jgi:hypothetical protein
VPTKQWDELMQDKSIFLKENIRDLRQRRMIWSEKKADHSRGGKGKWVDCAPSNAQVEEWVRNRSYPGQFSEDTERYNTIEEVERLRDAYLSTRPKLRYALSRGEYGKVEEDPIDQDMDWDAGPSERADMEISEIPHRRHPHTNACTPDHSDHSASDSEDESYDPMDVTEPPKRVIKWGRPNRLPPILEEHDRRYAEDKRRRAVEFRKAMVALPNKLSDTSKSNELATWLADVNDDATLQYGEDWKRMSAYEVILGVIYAFTPELKRLWRDSGYDRKHGPQTWREFKTWLKDQIDQEIIDEEEDARQSLIDGACNMQNKSLAQYISAYRRICKKIPAMTEKEKVMHFRRGLSEALTPLCIVNKDGHTWSTLDKLLKHARTEDLIITHTGRAKAENRAHNGEKFRPRTQWNRSRGNRNNDVAGRTNHLVAPVQAGACGHGAPTEPPAGATPGQRRKARQARLIAAAVAAAVAPALPNPPPGPTAAQRGPKAQPSHQHRGQQPAHGVPGQRSAQQAGASKALRDYEEMLRDPPHKPFEANPAISVAQALMCKQLNTCYFCHLHMSQCHENRERARCKRCVCKHDNKPIPPGTILGMPTWP